MLTRSASRKKKFDESGQEESLPVNGVDSRPRKRARRKDQSQLVQGGWDVLPHNLGRIDVPVSEGGDTTGLVENESVCSTA